jgi:hypothetical protein
MMMGQRVEGCVSWRKHLVVDNANMECLEKALVEREGVLTAGDKSAF